MAHSLWAIVCGPQHSEHLCLHTRWSWAGVLRPQTTSPGEFSSSLNISSFLLSYKMEKKKSLLSVSTVLNVARETDCPLVLPTLVERQRVNFWKASGHFSLLSQHICQNLSASSSLGHLHAPFLSSFPNLDPMVTTWSWPFKQHGLH